MIEVVPIGYVRSERDDLSDDRWGAQRATIELVESFDPQCFDGLEEFSHAEVLFHFHRVPAAAVESTARHPRGNLQWPRVGIFAQRGKNRPNRLGTTIVEIAGRTGRVLTVVGLDAIDGTPVIDIKPVMAEFLPRGAVRQPSWSHELMQRYWE